MLSNFAPIVLFVYNRPVHARYTLEALSKNLLADVSKLYIYADGPKENDTEENYRKIKEVRDIIKEKKWCGEIEIIERNKNMGLANSIITGVTEIVNKHGKIIVLEDDLIVSKGFLTYMNEALSLYSDNEMVMNISGYMFPLKTILPETFFLKLTSSWGWGTWQRAWNLFNNNSVELIRSIKTVEKFCFNINDSYNYYGMLQQQALNKIDSWAINWYASVFINKGYGLFPYKSLVCNIGHDGSGIHHKANMRQPVLPEINAVDVKKKEISENKTALTYLAKYHQSDIDVPYCSFLFQKFNKMLNFVLPKPVTPSNRIPDKHQLDMNIYWSPQMAELLETWGKDNVWNEIQMFLVNCKGRVLDIACGTGVTMAILSKHPSLELYGVDISDFLINKAIGRGINKQYLQVCDITNMGIYKDDFFDYSYSIGSLEHLTEEGIMNVISEIYRITKNISFHQMPVSRSGKDEGWITPYQSYYNNSEKWWIEKFKIKFPIVHIIHSGWNDNQSVGRWFVCIK